MRSKSILAVVVVLLAFNSGSQAVTVDWVTVGNAGNAGELSGSGAGGSGPDAICGAVDYEYQIGKYEVTAGQYCEFLNAVAGTDTYGLYNRFMVDDSAWGCKIQQTGISGNYVYSVAADYADRPVNYVGWVDAARFTNWLYNGQPTGIQDISTTENGSYYINGATTRTEIVAITRQADATWVIPSEDEWYKAAYHKNDGITNNYFSYPTSSNSVPSNDLINPDAGNSATFYDSDYTIGSPFWRTEVGEHENSKSPYNVFDMGGNVWEWNESTILMERRGLRGGSFSGVPGSGPNGSETLLSVNHYYDYAESEYFNIGFRVASVPEPVTLLLLGLGGFVLRRR